MSALELGANAVNAVSIMLAGRNSIHTWWTGIIGCLLFAALFAQAKLYGDATLQLFFIGTSVAGFLAWRARTAATPELPVRRTAGRELALFVLTGAAVALAYAFLLERWTDAAAPLPDSLVLAFSAVAQLLLMKRRVENWGFWLLVNTVAVPLFASRGLYLTAALYAFFWVNALVSWRHWQQLLRAAEASP
jgi:nicotinamide mononucleotide transporter